MNKPLYFLIPFIFFSGLCFAQILPPRPDTMRVIEILDGKNLREKSIDSVNKLQIIAGNVLLRERLTKFSCDSAIINSKENTIEAFGNVHINDADSLHTYSQYLKYYGNQRLAHLTKNVKLTDKKGILLTQDLQYDLGKGTGTYNTGGKVINGSTVLTSKEGIYYADTKDVYFRNNVDLVDPKYKIKADSLLYNTQTDRATFIGPTHIKSNQADIFTKEGYYDLKNGNAYFGTRSLVTDSSRRIYQADNIAIDENAGLAELQGNGIIKDSANGVIVTANHIYLNNKNSSFLAVNKPVMIIQQAKDSIYISADTLFSGFTPKFPEKVRTEKIDSAKTDTAARDLSTHFFNAGTPKQLVVAKRDTATFNAADTLLQTPVKPIVNDTLPSDSTKQNNIASTVATTGTRKVALKFDSASRQSSAPKPLRDFDNGNKNVLSKNDTTEKTKVPGADTTSVKSKDSSRLDSLGLKPLAGKVLTADSVKGAKVINLNKADTAVRYFLAFHHVRIFNDSMQSVCDSLFFSAADSVFRLFRDPVVWSGESQVTGDTIYLFTKNKEPEHLYVFYNGMIVNQSSEELYNQISGKTINAYFKGGAIDYARIKGQKAESIYYVQDRDSSYKGMNNSTGDVIDMFFLKGELNKVKFVNDVEGTMYPMKHIPPDKKLLKNFKWLDKRRPKNKLELFE